MLNITSIKQFLLISIIALITLVWAVSSSIIYHESQEQIEEVFDAELAQLSRMLQAVITTNIKLSSNNEPKPLTYLDKQIFDGAFGHQEYNARGHKYEKKLAFQVWNTRGQLFFENHIQLPKSFTNLKAGFHTLSSDSIEWRSFTLKDEAHGFWIKVAQREDVRTELTNEIAWNTTWPSLAIVPFLMLILGWVIQKGLSPLQIISAELKGRDYDNLSKLKASDYPKELKQMVFELNNLFHRVNESQQRERRFTADAAHELRTPLSISKVHLQNIQQVSTNTQVIDFVSKALIGINRLIHMVQQLLILSRLDAQQDERKAAVNLATLCNEAMLEMKQIPELSHHEMRISVLDKVEIIANETSLRILLRNLFDNACRYARPNTVVEVTITESKISILNQCPALDKQTLAFVFDRFKRGASSNKQGSGLGLSICLQICQLNKFKLSLTNRQDGTEGLCSEVRLNEGDSIPVIPLR
jgi:two-component system sensor histidine kinase QseC